MNELCRSLRQAVQSSAAWQDRQAFDTHTMAPHTRQFREQLAPMAGSLYDERLYRALP